MPPNPQNPRHIVLRVQGGQIICPAKTDATKNQKVQWICCSGSWEVQFPVGAGKSPFSVRTISGSKGQLKGATVNGAKKSYKYTVKIGALEKDPDLDIV